MYRIHTKKNVLEDFYHFSTKSGNYRYAIFQFMVIWTQICPEALFKTQIKKIKNKKRIKHWNIFTENKPTKFFQFKSKKRVRKKKSSICSYFCLDCCLMCGNTQRLVKKKKNIHTYIYIYKNGGKNNWKHKRKVCRHQIKRFICGKEI